MASGRVLADDELLGHAFDVRADGLGHDAGGQLSAKAGAHDAGAHLEDLGHILVVACEVFVNVAGQGVRCVQVGQDVHKAEQLHLEAFVFHGPVHDFAGPPALVENGRGFTGNAGKKLLAAISDLFVQHRYSPCLTPRI
jgi:hypothetical protein